LTVFGKNKGLRVNFKMSEGRRGAKGKEHYDNNGNPST